MTQKMVEVTLATETLRGVESARFARGDGEWVTIQLDEQKHVRNLSNRRDEFWSFITVRAEIVKSVIEDGVEFDFGHRYESNVKWTFNGTSKIFLIGRDAARAYAAMARVDKIQAIKLFKLEHSSGLREAKDCIEAFMNRL